MVSKWERWPVLRYAEANQAEPSRAAQECGDKVCKENVRANHPNFTMNNPSQFRPTWRTHHRLNSHRVEDFLFYYRPRKIKKSLTCKQHGVQVKASPLGVRTLIIIIIIILPIPISFSIFKIARRRTEGRRNFSEEMGSIAKKGLQQYLIQLQQHPLRTKVLFFLFFFFFSVMGLSFYLICVIVSVWCVRNWSKGD